MNADALSAPADVVGPVARAPEAAEVGRCCSHPDCRTKLSRYNPDDCCTAHGGWSDATVKRPGRKPAHRDSGDAAHIRHDQVGRRDPVVLIGPVIDLTDSSDSDVVMAELSLQPSLDTVEMRRMLCRIGNLLAQTPLEVLPQPSGVVVSGELCTIMEAVEQIHRLASRQRNQVVTTVKVIRHP